MAIFFPHFFISNKRWVVTFRVSSTIYLLMEITLTGNEIFEIGFITTREVRYHHSYKSQRGYYAPYVPGYDGHGLPIENKVVKNIKGGREAVTPAELRQKCREYAFKSLKGQENEFKRLGVWGDWAHPYVTINPEYEAEQVRVFGEMYKKGYIEKGLKPVYWCASCETALAEAEVEYADITTTSIYVRFKFDDDSTQKIAEKLGIEKSKSIYSVIWTTTPWTIPSNIAISLHPRFEYVFFEHDGDIYFVVQEL